MSIDLKSGPNVTLGTHVITLDKFFEGQFSSTPNALFNSVTGNLRATKWLDLGNSKLLLGKVACNYN